METVREPAIKTIAISAQMYNTIENIRANEGKRTVKEVAEQLFSIALAVKRGEYTRAKETVKGTQRQL